MNTRRLYWIALALSALDVAACVLTFHLRPASFLAGLAGLCAACGVTAGQYLWRTRKAGVLA